MGMRIVFNGREYAGPEAMPAGVREAYERALRLAADAGRTGVPEQLNGGAPGDVVHIYHSSVTVNGRTYDGPDDLPPPVRRLYEQAVGQASGGDVAGAAEATGPGSPTAAGAGDGWSGFATGGGPTLGPDDPGAVLNQVSRVLEGVLWVLLGFAAAVILAGAVYLMAVMDASSRSQGGRLYVAVAAVVALGAVDSRFAWLARRRWALYHPGAYRRYRLGSLTLLAAAAAGLVGLALLLP